MSQIDLYIHTKWDYFSRTFSAYNKRIRSKRIWIECIVVLDAVLGFLHVKKRSDQKRILIRCIVELDAFDKDKRNRNKKQKKLPY